MKRVKHTQATDATSHVHGLASALLQDPSYLDDSLARDIAAYGAHLALVGDPSRPSTVAARTT